MIMRRKQPIPTQPMQVPYEALNDVLQSRINNAERLIEICSEIKKALPIVPKKNVEKQRG